MTFGVLWPDAVAIPQNYPKTSHVDSAGIFAPLGRS